MKLGLVPLAKNRVNENLFFNFPVDLFKIVHVKLTNEGTPVVVSEVLLQHIINEELFIMDNQFVTVLVEVYNFRKILHRRKYTFIMARSLEMKSVTSLAEI